MILSAATRRLLARQTHRSSSNKISLARATRTGTRGLGSVSVLAGSGSISASALSCPSNKSAGIGVGSVFHTPPSRLLQQQQSLQQQRRSLHLTPRELDHLRLHECGRLAQYRLARGLKLNIPESVALITSVMMERIRDGETSVADLMSLGQSLLGRRQVQAGVPDIVKDVQIEATFPDGTKLLTIHGPISKLDGDLNLALEGSFLPVPELSAFGDLEEDESSSSSKPGAVTLAETGEGITLNSDRLDSLVEVSVTNTGDRPVQVGSHYAFLETNKALRFDRKVSICKRLNIPSGASVRFEPGETKTVTLVDIGGSSKVVSGNRLHNGENADDEDAIMERVKSKGFLHATAAEVPKGQPLVVERSAYADMYGPTTGDKIKLGDTSLEIQVEYDLTSYGEECKFGGGKTLREGMGQSTSVQSNKALDVVITNALIVDSVIGIIKADIGIKGNRIVGIGKAGNPDMMSGVVDENMVVGATTDVIAGEKLILTAGGIDTHVHYICPQQFDDAIASGLTTMFGGGTGPSAGTSATTCTPAPTQFEMMLKATDGIPMNFGFSGKGNTSDASVLMDCLMAGAAGFKLHEDWGTTPSAIDACLGFADEHDIAVTIHTDTLNESGFVDDSIAAMKGRTIHTYHTEGAGGGHAPDIIKIVQEPYVLPSSTNPTRPFTVNTMDEHLDMLMVCHHLDSSIPEDVAFAESRIRAETIAAEDILHDIGAISIISSDSQAMGRVGEVITRTWQTACKMKTQRGALEEDSGKGNDNTRVKRYLAKYTINPAITHGMSQHVGSVEVGKLADLVLWKPSMFGAKPEMIVKGGAISWSQMGDPNASIPTPQPVQMRPMFGALASGRGHEDNRSIAFVSKAAAEIGNVRDKYGLTKSVEGVTNCRNVTKLDMVLNDALPRMEVDPETFEVKADGEVLYCEPLEKVPLAQKYFLF